MMRMQENKGSNLHLLLITLCLPLIIPQSAHNATEKQVRDTTVTGLMRYSICLQQRLSVPFLSPFNYIHNNAAREDELIVYCSLRCL